MRKEDFLAKQKTGKPRQVETPSGETFFVRSVNQFDLAVLSSHTKEAYGASLDEMSGANLGPYKQLHIVAYCAFFALCDANGEPWFDCGTREQPKKEVLQQVHDFGVQHSIEDLQAITEGFLAHNTESLDKEAAKEAGKNLQTIPIADSK